MDFTAFSHGQIQSKLWLCESLEPYISPDSRIAILGSWYNILGFLMVSRKPTLYNFITGIDKDKSVIDFADKFCEGYMIQPNVKIKNICQDANTFDLQGFNVVINCSVEHMESNAWFGKLTAGTLVCIQSSNVIDSDDKFDIKTPIQNIDTLSDKFPLKKIYHKKTKNFQYNEWGYSRYMLIGLK